MNITELIDHMELCHGWALAPSMTYAKLRKTHSDMHKDDRSVGIANTKWNHFHEQGAVRFK